MKKGDRVAEIGYEDEHYIKGTVLKVDENEDPPVTVVWDTGIVKYYQKDDLTIITEDQPSFDRTAIATQILSGMMPQRQIVQIQSKKEEIVATAIELADELIKQLSA